MKQANGSTVGAFAKTNAMMLGAVLAMLSPLMAYAADGKHQPGGEVNIVLPDLKNQIVKMTFVGGMSGWDLLTYVGLPVCVLGLAFGVFMYAQLKNMPVHRSMLEISELIYETCKAYLLRQGKFLMILWAFVNFL